MKPWLAFVGRYVKYWVVGANGKGHGIHSPFVFDFVRNVLPIQANGQAIKNIEGVRQKMLNSTTTISVDDFGAGSKVFSGPERVLGKVASTSLKPSKYSSLLYRMVEKYKPSTILELGTSLGITTAYLASANPAARVFTIEGAKEIANIATQNFQELKLYNITLVLGNFDDALPPTLKVIGDRLDFVFIDGNHRYEPTVKYFNALLPYLHDGSIVVFDDVHWSDEMERAWETIKSHPQTKLSIDLFYIGIVFFRVDNREKEHHVIRF